MTLKKYLISNMLTYRSFSKKVDMAEAQVARYANGASIPNLKNALKIYKATDKKVTMEDWFKPIPKRM